jgi:hypothetical protein
MRCCKSCFVPARSCGHSFFCVCLLRMLRQVLDLKNNSNGRAVRDTNRSRRAIVIITTIVAIVATAITTAIITIVAVVAVVFLYILYRIVLAANRRFSSGCLVASVLMIIQKVLKKTWLAEEKRAKQKSNLSFHFAFQSSFQYLCQRLGGLHLALFNSYG